MFVKSGALAQQEEINLDVSLRKEAARRRLQSVVTVFNVGDHTKCPECAAMGRVVYVSQDKKTMGVQCPASHRGSKSESKYGATAVTLTKTRKNVVFLTTVGK